MVSSQKHVHQLAMIISVIIPCFNEEKVLPQTYARILALPGNEEGMEYELVFVDDGSTDRTPAILREFALAAPRVNFIRFSRNFGHQPAVSAGIRHCRGRLAVII